MNKAINSFSCYSFVMKWNLYFLVFKISSSHANTNLPIRRFSGEQLSVSKYSLILLALFYWQLHVLGFPIQSSLQEHQSSNSLHSHWHSSWLDFCFEWHKLSFNPHIYLHDSWWTKNLVSFTLFGTQTQA